VRNNVVRSVVYALSALTAPVLNPLRKIIPPVGGLDLTFLVLLLLIQLVRSYHPGSCRLLVSIALECRLLGAKRNEARPVLDARWRPLAEPRESCRHVSCMGTGRHTAIGLTAAFDPKRTSGQRGTTTQQQILEMLACSVLAYFRPHWPISIFVVA
jgi:hypothetical protein